MAPFFKKEKNSKQLLFDFMEGEGVDFTYEVEQYDSYHWPEDFLPYSWRINIDTNINSSVVFSDYTYDTSDTINITYNRSDDGPSSYEYFMDWIV